VVWFLQFDLVSGNCLVILRMSGFFGVFSPGRKLDQLAFDQMKSAIKTDGYSKLNTYIDGQIAMGHLMVRITPEAEYDKQPLKSDCSRYILVGHFRLDYRDELGDKLGLTQKELEQTPDSLLVMKSYQKWGNNCVHHLEGDWSFVLYDFEASLLKCFKDKYGNSALFYSILGEFICVSSTVELFNCIPSISNNPDWHQLIRLSISGLGIELNKTILQNVFRLSPCCFIIVHSNLTIKKVVYFEIQKNSKEKYKNEYDYELDFRSHLSMAIRSRIRGIQKLGISLSSGLDSNAILYFASKEFEFNNRKVHTYTYCNAYLEQIEEKYHKYISDDFYIRSTLKGNNNIIPSFLTFNETDFSREFHDSTCQFDTPIVTKNNFWVKNIITNAKKDNIQILLNGQLGNFTITWNAPNLFITNFLKGNFKYVCKQFLYIQKLNGFSIFRIAWINLCLPLLRKVRFDLKYLFGLQTKQLIKHSIFHKSILSKAFSKGIIDLKSTSLHFPSLIDTSKIHKAAFQLNAEVTGERWFSTGFNKGIVTADPTADIRLTNFIFSLPSRFFFNNGCQKNLFRKILKGRVDDLILNNNYTIHQSYDLPNRMINDSFIFDLINTLNKNTALTEVFDMESINSSFQVLNSIKANNNYKYIEAVKLINDLSILYLYEYFYGIKRN
jgi:asparagine synthase (glutamine-hydrolysing)